MVRDMTQGHPLKLILGFCIPMMFGSFFQQFYNMADSIIVGRFIGPNALAAVGSTGSVNFLIIGFVLGLCSGFCIPVAQCFGAENYEGMRKCICHAVYLSAGFTVLVTTVTMLLTGQLLQLMRTPTDIFEDAYSYIIVLFAGTAAIVLYNLLSGILRALGDSKTPLYFLIFASILNIGLDLLFVVVFKSGVAGAGYATVIAQTISGFCCFVYIMKKFPILKLERADWKPEKAYFKRLTMMGVPMGLQFSITAIGSTILQSAVNTLGTAAVTAVTAAAKVQMLIIQPLETLGATMATYCGQNLGAGKIKRIETGVKQSLIAGTVYAVFAAILAATVGSFIALLFLDSGETEILANVRLFLTINGTSYILLNSLLVLRNAIQGLGYAVPAMAAGVFEMVARALVALCLVTVFQFPAVCLANPAAWVAANILLIPVYLKVIKGLRQSFPVKEED